MTKRTPEQTLMAFEHRTGTQEIPTLGGMSRLGDEAQIPLRNHHLLVNVRFGPGELGSRPGLTETENIGVEACITGIIETVENNPGSGAISGLLIGYNYGIGAFDGDTHFFVLNPQDDEDQLNGSEYRPLIKQPPSFGAGSHVWETWWPLGGMISHYFGSRGCQDSIAIPGPLFPFEFQGNTCVLGGYPEVGLFAITAPQDGEPGTASTPNSFSAGALSRITNFGSGITIPMASAIRSEIIGGAIKEVLYFSDYNGKIYRFDGTTLSEWADTTTILGAEYAARMFVSGQEMLILCDTKVPIDETGSPNPPGVGPFASGSILYQPAPGEAISVCSFTAPYSTFDTNPVTGETAQRLIGWTGAARYRDKWYICLYSGPGNRHGGTPQQYSQILEAPVGGASLAFTLAHAGYAAAPPVRTASSLNFSQIANYRDTLYYFTNESQITFADGPCTMGQNNIPGADDYQFYLGKFDGSVWQDKWLRLGGAAGEYYESGQGGWILPVGASRLLVGVGGNSFSGGVSPADQIWETKTEIPSNNELNWDITTNTDIQGPSPPFPGGNQTSRTAYYAVPDDELEEGEV